ncbi:MAG: DUF692 domain-containing protein [Acidobacteriota bacterium]|nr:DUF692 domain-containing protein [Acidobacteriota bacterium]
MTSVEPTSLPIRQHPALATTYEGVGADLLERIVPLVDYLEIPPDSIAQTSGKTSSLRPEILAQLESVSRDVNIIAHGVGLSIGSCDRWNEPYLHLLDQLFSRLTPRWHSEHLAYTTVAGENLGTMLALSRTEPMLDLLCERIRLIQERYRVPFLIEHVIHLLPDAPATYTAAGFLNALTARTGCGLILDAYNLECDQHNFAFNIAAFLDELNLDPVRELHVAGGFEHQGMQLDIHSQPTADSTLNIAAALIRRCPNLDIVTYEFLKEAIPLLGHNGICSELTRIRRALSPC